MKKYKVGYVQGVFDMFHIGHLNLLKCAKNQCDYLIVAVNTDELVEQYKNKKTMIPFKDRAEIVSKIKYVDKVVKAEDRDKFKAYKRYRFDALLMGSDWKGTDFYNELERDFKKIGVDIVYFPYTKNISSSMLREKILKDNENKMISQT